MKTVGDRFGEPLPRPGERSHVEIIVRQLEAAGALFRKQSPIALNRRIDAGHIHRLNLGRQPLECQQPPRRLAVRRAAAGAEVQHLHFGARILPPAIPPLLRDQRGVLAPFADPKAIAREASGLLRDGTRRNAMRDNAYRLGREMVWSNTAGLYMRCFDLARRPWAAPRRESFAAREVSLPTRRHSCATLRAP